MVNVSIEEKILKVAVKAAKRAGKYLKKVCGKIKEFEDKGGFDPVTEADKKSEEIIKQTILKTFPQHQITGEESGTTAQLSEFRWVVDPLDGTKNFLHGVPYFCISIAIFRGKDLFAGVIYNPLLDEIFWALKGKGAYRNNRSIRVSSIKKMEEALIVTGFPHRAKEHFEEYSKMFRKVFLKSQGIRRMGAAALDLAYTACGFFEGFFEMKLNPWDIAAGALLVKEAGGTVSDFEGGNSFFETGDILAANPYIHPKLLELLKT